MNFETGLLVCSTDFINANPIVVEFGIGDLATLGRLLVATNLSDICGTGAEPKGILVSCTMPKSTTDEEFKKLASGIQFESRKWGVPVLGGDTKIGKSMALCATVFGRSETTENLFLKYNAQPGDSIWVSGELGAVGAAVLDISANGYDSMKNEWARIARAEPNLPLAKSRELAARRIANGGTDISDGCGD